jgi:transgelin
MNKLQPGSISKIHTTGGPMKLRENVGLFQHAARAYGVDASEVFQVVDLFDKQNIQQVTVGVHPWWHRSTMSIHIF